MASFPKTLFAYEIALDDALRARLGAGVDRFPAPDPREVSDAFFHREPAGSLAERLIEADRFHPPEIRESGGEDTPPDEGTPELF